MKAPPFEYVRATSVEEACALLGQYGDGAKVLAGGQNLVPMMAFRLLHPSWLIDINEIPALKFVAVETDVVRMGACARQCDIQRDDAIAARAPLLRQALSFVGHAQTRNRGTVGGSLAHADPSAELPLVAQVLGASLVLRAASSTRTLPASSFFSGPMMTELRPDECLEQIHWPVWRDRKTGSSFNEISRRHGDFAIVAAAAQIAVDDDDRCTRAAFGVGGAGPMPVAFPDLAQRLVGCRLGEDELDDVAWDAAAALEPDSDIHATAAYRRHLAGVLVTRVLQSAYEAAKAVP
ncbi:MAG: xanthine dehydrogenase family protein subunit M [Rhizobiales bacterium]|nr:xanthine dehydrogenase family protein subunit M [Hyphomicrobiales bacterium]